MALLYWFESIRNPVLDKIMLLITGLGEETAFLALAIIFFWCIDKRRGYYILSVGFFGTIINQFLKMSFRIDRPFEIHKDFNAVEGALEEATGFSFPSGHTQSSVGTFGSIAKTAANKAFQILCIAIAILVPISRMYLGVHTPQDVLVSAVIAVSLIFLVYPFTAGKHQKYFPVVILVMIVLSVAYIIFVMTYNFPSDVNAERLLSGKESAFTLFGALCGLIVVYTVDEKWLDFPVKAVWWAQLIKVVIGLCLVLAVKSGLKSILNDIFGVFVGRGVRYFLVVLVAGFLWPLSFKWFSRLGNKE